ncbi:hypothetical protein SADUNF_Sadunf04G0096400 [Salix dunnii]|uniref:Uncharacterized protein n=1 Tax=Salix dunnii TaxID=1413687 RepID=A0A835N2U8_9ROSI|nr:hypothetical protein SADUNF_Sadunf04G0096400 [Salix dunnii]
MGSKKDLYSVVLSLDNASEINKEVEKDEKSKFIRQGWRHEQVTVGKKEAKMMTTEIEQPGYQPHWKTLGQNAHHETNPHT